MAWYDIVHALAVNSGSKLDTFSEAFVGDMIGAVSRSHCGS